MPLTPSGFSTAPPNTVPSPPSSRCIFAAGGAPPPPNKKGRPCFLATDNSLPLGHGRSVAATVRQCHPDGPVLGGEPMDGPWAAGSPTLPVFCTGDGLLSLGLGGHPPMASWASPILPAPILRYGSHERRRPWPPYWSDVHYGEWWLWHHGANLRPALHTKPPQPAKPVAISSTGVAGGRGAAATRGFKRRMAPCVSGDNRFWPARPGPSHRFYQCCRSNS